MKETNLLFKSKRVICQNVDLLQKGLIHCCNFNLNVRTSVLSNLSVKNVSVDYYGPQGTQSYVTSADLDSIDNRYLLCGKSDGGFSICDSHKVTDERKYETVVAARGSVASAHKHPVDCVQWYAADTGLFTTSSVAEEEVKVWDPNSPCVVETFSAATCVRHHHMSPVAMGHSLVAVGTANGEVMLCDLRNGSSTHRLLGHVGPVDCIQWSWHDENCLVTGGDDRTIRVWDCRSGRSCLCLLDKEGSVNRKNIDGAADREIKRRRTATSRVVAIAHSAAISSLAFTSDGLWLVSVCQAGEIQVWNAGRWEMKTGWQKLRVTGRSRGGHCKMATANGTYLLFVPEQEYVSVFSLRTGGKVTTLRGHVGTVTGVVYDSWRQTVFTYGEDRHLLTWTAKEFGLHREELNGRKLAPVTVDTWSDED